MLLPVVTMSAIDDFHHRNRERVLAQAKAVADRFEAIDNRLRRRIVELLELTHRPVPTLDLILADRHLHGSLSGLGRDQVDRLCQDLHYAGIIDLQIDGEKGMTVYLPPSPDTESTPKAKMR